MKKISTLFVILALLAMNVASVACVHAADVANNGIDIVQSLDASNDSGIPSKQLVQCHQCCCHAGSHILLGSTKVSDYNSLSAWYFAIDDDAYPSALDSPPFQPPKA